MIILDHEQGSPEWMNSRAGVLSASMIDKLITGAGVISKSREKLLYGLAGERILGSKEEGYSNAAMQRGVEMEEEARLLFELITGEEVEEVGFCLQDDKKHIGCSPDGIIAKKKKGLEIKCPSLAVHVEYLLKNKLPSTYFQQVQSSMFVTGFEQWHFFSYYPGMQPLNLIIERDETWIAKLSKAVTDFNKELDETHKNLLEMS